MRYEDIVESVRNGSKFNISFEERRVRIDGKEIDITDLCVPVVDLDEALRLIEYHYINYKRSVPSERNDSKGKRYFRADKMEDLSDRELCCNEQREVAQVELELLVLGFILNSSLIWDNKKMNGTWFWKSKKYPELIILKNWIGENV